MTAFGSWSALQAAPPAALPTTLRLPPPLERGSKASSQQTLRSRSPHRESKVSQTDEEGGVVVRFPASPGYEYDLLHSENLTKWKVATTGTFPTQDGVFVWRSQPVYRRSNFFKIARRRLP